MAGNPQKNFRLTPETIRRLDAVSAKCFMSEGELITALINKVYKDETMQNIIVKYRDLERMRKAGIDPTTYNVRTDNGVKNAPGQTSAPSNESGTSSITEAQEDDNAYEAELQRIIEIAKAKWVSED